MCKYDDDDNERKYFLFNDTYVRRNIHTRAYINTYPHANLFTVIWRHTYGDKEKGNPLPPHGLLFPISSKGYFICIIPQTG